VAKQDANVLDRDLVTAQPGRKSVPQIMPTEVFDLGLGQTIFEPAT
jgi:hypothetical protein